MSRPQEHTAAAKEILATVEAIPDEVLRATSDRGVLELLLSVSIAQVHATIGATR